MANYLSALDQLQGQKAAAGDIDGVVALKQERDRVTNHAQPTAADLQAMSAPVRKLRATYEADTRKAADEAVRRDKLARSSYLANLEALQKRMNAAGEIEQGLLVKAEKDRYIEELIANKSGASAAPRQTLPQIPPPNAGTTRNIATSDPFQTGSVWSGEERGYHQTLTILERSATTFRARFEIGTIIVREITGSVKGNRISWFGKDVHATKGGPGGDDVGIVTSDKIEITWRDPKNGKTGGFTLLREQGRN